jgi:hypothetical protein
MGRISSPKLFYRSENKRNGELLRTLNGFDIHEAPRPNETKDTSRITPNIRYFHYV